MGRIRNHPTIKNLISLDLPEKDFTIFGSAPMFAYGISGLESDLDVVARGKAWEKAKSFGKPKKAPLGNKAISLFNGTIEITNGWVPGKWDIGELINTSELIEGIRFVSLENVLKWKKKMGRKKDLKHIKMIADYFEKI